MSFPVPAAETASRRSNHKRLQQKGREHHPAAVLFSLAMLLEVDNLRATFRGETEEVAILRGITFTVHPGERVALVGESGCGKSITSLSLTRLPPTNRAQITGSIKFHGKELTAPHPKIAYIFQDPIASLNPVMKIGKQLKEAQGDAECDLEELLAAVALHNPKAILSSYPCELSGGMCQRVMIAMGLARNPDILIADEPTTALDVTTQAEVMDLISKIVEERKMALLMATHNLGLVAGRCDTVHVLYAGQIVESGPVSDVLKNPIHPYTQGLIRAVPKISSRNKEDLKDIPGTVPTPQEISKLANGQDACVFRPRCKYATDACTATVKTISENNRSWRCLRTR